MPRPPCLAAALLAACALTLSAPLARAEVLFQFGPSAAYTEPVDPAGSTVALRSGNLPFRTPSGATQSSGWRAFSGGPLTPAAPYAGPVLYGGYSVSYLELSGTAPTLFVGYGATSSTATTGTYFQTGLRHDRPFNHLSPSAADALVVNAGYSSNASASGTLSAEVAFLVGARFETPAAVSALSADVRLPAGSTVRAVLRQGSAYYVSETARGVSASTGQSVAWTSADLSATAWSLYDPDKPAPGASAGVYHGVNYVSVSPRSLGSFDNVSFAGVLLTRALSSTSFTSANFAELQLASLRVEGTPGPVLDGVWQRIGLPPGGTNSINPSGARQVFAVQIDPARDWIYAGNRFVGSGPGSVLRSADEGLSWTPVGVSTGESWNLSGSGPNEEGFRLHPLRPDTWLFASENRGVYATFDAGATWRNVIPGWVTGGIGHGFEFQFHPTDPDRLWASGGVGVFRSDDGGATWTNRSAGMNNSQTQALRVDPANPSRLYAGQIWTTGGLFRSDDAGDSWQRIETGIGQPGERITPSGYYFVSTFQIELHPSRPGELYALTAKGLYRSTKYGDLWAPHAFIGASGVGTSLRSFKLHPHEPDTILAGGTTGKIFLSLDGGGQWTDITGDIPTGPMPNGEFMISVTEFQFDPRDPAVVYAARTDGLYRYRLPRPPVAPGALSRWRAAQFPAPWLADPAREADFWGDLAAPAGDGLPNLLKYHLGLDALRPATQPLAPASRPDGFAVRHRRARLAPDAEARVEWSEDLGLWSTQGLIETVLSRDETHEEVETLLPSPAARPRVFFRLRVGRRA